jgi:hypothetical protein
MVPLRIPGLPVISTITNVILVEPDEKVKVLFEKSSQTNIVTSEPTSSLRISRLQ